MYNLRASRLTCATERLPFKFFTCFAAVATLTVSGAGLVELPDLCACCSFAQLGNVKTFPSFGVQHFGDIAGLVPLDLEVVGHGAFWHCVDFVS
jgi:hypothetical protein